MSIYFSVKSRVQKTIFWITLISITIIFHHNSLAWEGYDYENSTTVEIGSGNLVREGNIIQIYDWKKGDYYDAEVKSIEDSFGGSKLEVYDFNEKKNHVLEMEKSF